MSWLSIRCSELDFTKFSLALGTWGWELYYHFRSVRRCIPFIILQYFMNNPKMTRISKVSWYCGHPSIIKAAYSEGACWKECCGPFTITQFAWIRSSRVRPQAFFQIPAPLHDFFDAQGDLARRLADPSRTVWLNFQMSWFRSQN